MNRQTLSIIVPCYNEEASVQLFISEVKKIESQMMNRLDFEYIFVDDGSSDGTLNILKQLHQTYNDVHYVSFTRNFGKEAAILAGLEKSTGDFVTLMDADLQDPPALLPEMYERIQKGFDIVGTRRGDRVGEGKIRSFFSSAFYKIMNRLSHTKIEEGARDYRLMTRAVVDSILQLKEVNRFSKGIFSWVGYKVDYITFDNVERKAGETSWSFWQLFTYSIEGIVNFSDAVLDIATWIGLGTFVFSFFGILFIISRKILFGDPVSGWPSLVVVMLFIGGIQLLALGILGKYISKIFMETKRRPIYLIKEEV